MQTNHHHAQQQGRAMFSLVVTPDRLSTDQDSFREDNSSNTGEINSGGPTAGRKKTDFEDYISRFVVWLPPPSETQKLPLQAESPSSRNIDNPAARRKKKDDTVDGFGV